MLIAQKFRVQLKGDPVPTSEPLLPKPMVAFLKARGVRTRQQLADRINLNFESFLSLLKTDPQSLMQLQERLIGNDLCSEQDKKDLEDLQCYCGLVEGDALTASEPPADFAVLMAAGIEPVPDDFDGKDLVENMPPIKNQGNRGTCVAHALVRCHEGARKSSNSGIEDLSEQFAYWHMKERDGKPTPGTSLDIGAETLREIGTCLETSCPYVQQKGSEHDDPQERGARPETSCEEEAKDYRINQFHILNHRDIKALTALLFKGIPIAYGVPVFDYWDGLELKRSGYITLPIAGQHKRRGAHAITLTGFGLDTGEPGGGFFIFDNSWGDRWGAECQFGQGRGILPFEFASIYGIAAVALTL